MAKIFSNNGMYMIGRNVSVDEYGAIPNLSFYRKHYDKVAAYTVLAGDTGAVFTNYGATTAVTFTLPAITDGSYEFEFVALADFAITIASGTADTLITFNDAAADSVALSTASEIIGGGVKGCCNGTYVYALQTGIGGHRQTLTVAT